MTIEDRLVRLETAVAQLGFSLYKETGRARSMMKAELAQIMQLRERRLVASIPPRPDWTEEPDHG